MGCASQHWPSKPKGNTCTDNYYSATLSLLLYVMGNGDVNIMPKGQKMVSNSKFCAESKIHFLVTGLELLGTIEG